MKNVVIIGGVRTPVGRYMGALKDVAAFDLGALVLNEAVKRAGVDPVQVDEVVLGQSYQSGEYVNIARMSLLKAGWPDSIPGITLDRRCCTGLDVIYFAAMKIQSDNVDIIVAGGVESMSTAEFYVPGDIKWGIGGKKGMPRGHGNLSTTLATKKVTIYTEILLSCEYCVEQNLFPRAHLRGIFNRHGNHYTANATLLKFWPR